jgi:hypothetical protein
VAHGVEDACAQQPVAACFRQADGLDEVPLGEAVQAVKSFGVVYG